MKKDIELITTSSSAMKVSEGVGWGMEGDLFLYLVCGMLGSMFLMLALISFFHVSIFISFIIALLPVTGAVQDALGKGVQKAASLYADLMLSKILKDGFFVRCPAGSTFYLYVEQTIDLRKATIGGSKVEDVENRASNSGTHPYVYTPDTINQQRTALENRKQQILKKYPQLNSEAGTK